MHFDFDLRLSSTNTIPKGFEKPFLVENSIDIHKSIDIKLQLGSSSSPRHKGASPPLP
jgi:hypothetical protein